MFHELFCQFFQIFYIDNHAICNQRQFHLFLFNPYTFYFLSFSNFISRTFNTMLGVVRRDISYLISDLTGKTSSFSLLSIMLSVDFLQIFFLNQTEEVPFSSSFLRRLIIINGFQILSDDFYASIHMITWIFFYSLQI